MRISIFPRENNRFRDETETLNTDVMRFLAIICMCLMMIFSLVQTLPSNSSSIVTEKEKTSRQQQAVQKTEERLTHQITEIHIKQVRLTAEKRQKKTQAGKIFNQQMAINRIKTT